MLYPVLSILALTALVTAAPAPTPASASPSPSRVQPRQCFPIDIRQCITDFFCCHEKTGADDSYGPKCVIQRCCDGSRACFRDPSHPPNTTSNFITVIDRKGLPEKEAPTVLDAIFTSPLIKAEDKTVTRMLAETQAILGAGTETTGNTLSVFTYHVLSQPTVLKSLKAELQDGASKSADYANGKLMDFKTLERLPYLQVCIKEALRLATGVSSRLPRINRTAPTLYTLASGKTYTLPPGTVISMSIFDLHYNPTIFTDPTAFDPLRWLESDAEKLQQMERAYSPFGRGARQCVGLHLAKEEITLMTGNLFHGIDLELFETSARDVSIAHDHFAPFAPVDSKGPMSRTDYAFQNSMTMLHPKMKRPSSSLYSTHERPSLQHQTSTFTVSVEDLRAQEASLSLRDPSE
ncbi:Uu.00g076580.m01.CDS01 [Anthostomella pinea]|uniref:Uu.00g076580.m01.CDS01 n=1 Tax=Anthostomella pinea TaxID=933095 RepID=A0AAI8YP78_9PEZI|nr:Uu.00g076580.m01.CDS01 [Anthostomella pinea]